MAHYTHVKKTSTHADEEHGHNHDHAAPGHSHSHNAAPKILLIAVCCTLAFAGVEAVVGWMAHSLTLLSDAGHMASDSLALGIAAFAAWIASRPPSAKHSYGLSRAEVLGAWISSLLMVAIVVVIIIEAIERFSHPAAIAGGWVVVVGIIGFLINLAIAWMLSRGEKTLNVRAAIVHVMGDLLGSVAAIISGAVIYFKNWTLIDPILSIFISLLILFSSLQLLRESMVVLMEGVPLHLNLEEIGNAMAKINQVKSIHDLHIWTLSSGIIVLSAHVEIENFSEWEAILENLAQLLKQDFAIEHITLQPETHNPEVSAEAFVMAKK
jgi:cobalt-zinc-cadmium efflux system protein